MNFKILLVLLLISTPVFAEECSLSEALRFKYYKPGADIQTQEDLKTGEMYIRFWKHPDGTPQPTREEIETAKSECVAAKAQKKAEKEAGKEAVKQKLKFNDQEIQYLKELLS